MLNGEIVVNGDGYQDIGSRPSVTIEVVAADGNEKLTTLT
jgi:hypothetical protein